MVTSAIMHLGCYQEFKAALFTCTSLATVRRAAWIPLFFFLAILSHIVLMLSKAGDYT